MPGAAGSICCRIRSASCWKPSCGPVTVIASRRRTLSNLAGWSPSSPAKVEVPFKPASVVLQDFTGVPAVVDLAAMRSAMKRLGGDPKKINPLIPVDLVIDHSVQVDQFGTDNALELNVELEFARNRERYEFLRWGQQAFDNFRAVPPERGHRPSGELGIPRQRCVLAQGSSGGRWPCPTHWSARTVTRR